MIEQIKELVEWVAKTLCEADGHIWGLTSVPMMHKTYLSKARIILSHPDLALIDRSKELPENPWVKADYDPVMHTPERLHTYFKAQVDMTGAGFTHSIISLAEALKQLD